MPRHTIYTDRPDNDALVLAIPMHVAISIVTDGKYVWREFTHLMTLVHLYLLGGVDRQNLIWIYCDQDGTSVCLNVHRQTPIVL